MTPHIARSTLVCLCILILMPGCTSYNKPDQQAGILGAPVELDSSTSGFGVAEEVGTGLLVPNARGGTLLIPGAPRTAPNAAAEEAVELKLKTRELAAQLLQTRNNDALLGLVAMPTSFINLDDFNDTSPLGRYLGESMFYEFNQRSFPVREYRLTGSIATRPGGEFALSRALPPIPTNQSWAALLVGTYHRDEAAIFINARLVRPADGLVLRTAQLVLPINGLLARMTAKPPKPPFDSGSLRIISSLNPTQALPRTQASVASASR